MAQTPSNMLALGTRASDFLLPDTISDDNLSYENVAGEHATVVMFICNHCPFVIHVRDELVRLGQNYMDRGIGFVAISSNDVTTHLQDGPEKMKAFAGEIGLPFPYLYDQTQDAARAYRAACTPDFFVFDANRELVYRGRLDGATPGNDEPVTGKDLRAALDAVLAGQPVPEDQRPSVGCNIKWAA